MLTNHSSQITLTLFSRTVNNLTPCCGYSEEDKISYFTHLMGLPLNLPLRFPVTRVSSVFPCVRPAINDLSMAQGNIRSSTLRLSNQVYLSRIHLPLFWAWINILVVPRTVWALSLNWKPTAVSLYYLWCSRNVKAQPEKTFMNWTLSIKKKKKERYVTTFIWSENIKVRRKSSFMQTFYALTR